MENQEALERAKARAEAKIGFLKAFGVYVIVNVFLSALLPFPFLLAARPKPVEHGRCERLQNIK